jgi:hypothetical protein
LRRFDFPASSRDFLIDLLDGFSAWHPRAAALAQLSYARQNLERNPEHNSQRHT